MYSAVLNRPSVPLWGVVMIIPLKLQHAQILLKQFLYILYSPLPVCRCACVRWLHYLLSRIVLIFEQVAQTFRFSTVAIGPLPCFTCCQTKHIATWSARSHWGSISEAERLTPGLLWKFDGSIKVWLLLLLLLFWIVGHHCISYVTVPFLLSYVAETGRSDDDLPRNRARSGHTDSVVPDWSWGHVGLRDTDGGGDQSRSSILLQLKRELFQPVFYFIFILLSIQVDNLQEKTNII